VLRALDALIDAPIPGPSVRPLQGTVRLIRAGYHRLPRWRVIERTGEFVDALQLPELSLGDSRTTHAVATGGTAGPGSGMVTRFHKLIDWVQHVAGDLNRLSGRCVARPDGLLAWRVPERAVDGAQWALLKTFNTASVWLARAIDGSLTAIEIVAEVPLQVGTQPSHRQETVFLSLPSGIYRLHELWILEHRRQLVVGTAQEFSRATHASLAHRVRHPDRSAWGLVDRPGGEPPEVIVMMTRRTFLRAPEALAAYVVPAAWVLHPDEQIAEGPIDKPEGAV